jgi:hypothetical protein
MLACRGFITATKRRIANKLGYNANVAPCTLRCKIWQIIGDLKDESWRVLPRNYSCATPVTLCFPESDRATRFGRLLTATSVRAQRRSRRSSNRRLRCLNRRRPPEGKPVSPLFCAAAQKPDKPNMLGTSDRGWVGPSFSRPTPEVCA